MATYTTNFSSWSDFEALIAAGQDYKNSAAYLTVEDAALDLADYVLFTEPIFIPTSNTSITANYPNGTTAHLYGTNLLNSSAVVTRADIEYGAYTLVLKGSVNIGGVNPTGTITSLDFSGAGYEEHAVGKLSASGLNGVFNSWSYTYPTTPGSLTFAGTGTLTVDSDGYYTETYSTISIADGAGNMTSISGVKFTLSDYTPPPDYVDLLHSLLAGNDIANGSAGNNELYTFAGHDTLDGKAGADIMVGGAGNDIYIVDNIGDLVVEGPDQGTDLVKSSIDYQLPDNVENLTLTGTANIDGTGNSLANVITGNAGNNTLDGAAGADTMIGGAGNDTYYIDNLGDKVTENAGGGYDEIISTILGVSLAANVESLSYSGSENFVGIGNSLNNRISSGTGSDILDGAAGADSLTGGSGNDIYYVDNTGDLVVETDNNPIGGSGFARGLDLGDTIDKVVASVNFILLDYVEDLTLVGNARIGTGNSLDNILTGNVASNTLTGGAGNDTLLGGDGADTMDGGIGADTMTGGDGADTYVVDDLDDLVVETNALAAGGIDLVQASIDYTLGANLEKLTLTGTAAIDGTGNALANLITGNAGNNTLDGGLGTDTLVGGLGDDTYLVDLTATGALQDILTEAANAGTDSVILRGSLPDLVNAVTLTLAATLENLDASDTGTTKLNLTGNTLANTLTGNDAANTLNGGTGIDSLIGGLGNDTYVLDNAGDQISELDDEGTDLVNVAIATANQIYTLGDHIENGTLTNAVAFNLTGNTLDNLLTGNAAINTLTGGEGNDSLIGGAGADSLVGGSGDDSYGVDNLLDKITENADEGTDSVLSSVTWTLGANLEHLTLSGAAAINGTGNELDNMLTGNAAANVLNGGIGADTMTGDNGADTYVVDDEGDVVSETNALAAGGSDLVQASIDYTLGANLEKLTLTGTAAIDGTGNALANLLTGNAGNNTLDGGLGTDTLIGGLGDDSYLVDLTATGALQDLITEAANAGTDSVFLRGSATLATPVTLTLAATLEHLDASGTETTKLNLTGNTLANTLTGNDAANTLNGGTGADSLVGGLGNDTYVLDNAGDQISELDDEGTDLVNVAIATANQIYTLGDHIENGTLTNAVAFNLTGNTLDNLLTGNAAINTLTGGEGNDSLIGGAGADSLVGGSGDDSYGVDNLLDKITENADEGTDSVLSSVTWTLGANLEHLTLSGAAAINGTGNELDNMLTGNAAANVLNGGIGADTMTGDNGADTYVVDDEGDVVSETNALAAGGSDLVQASIDYTLGANLEKLTLTGTAAIDGTGNALANLLTGNAGNNTLDGGLGTDTLIGGLGDDSYLVNLTATGALQDLITEAANAGTDSVFLRGSATLATPVTLTLAATLEHLDASGTETTKLNLTGNTLANTLTGNDAANTLNGGTGADSLVGGLGNDTYVLDNAGDQISELDDEGTDLVNVAIAAAGGTYTLAANVENGTLTNAVAYNLTGNALDNLLTGNAAINTLTGGEGNDTLTGGAGADSLVGGFGNDTYVVDLEAELLNITENDGEGTDLLKVTYANAATTAKTITLANGLVNLDNITVTGTGLFNLTGNNLDNVLTGNASANKLNGGVGADTLVGGLGSDTYVVDDVLDVITETSSVSTEIDIVESGVNWTLGANLEKLTLTGSGHINGTGNTLANTLTGNSGNNRLDGGTGADVMLGGAGNDTYVVDNIGDKVYETTTIAATTSDAGGTDMVEASISYTLDSFVENLTLTGSGHINGSGNALANTLTGNDGANTLNGGTGADTLIGGDGDDTYVVDQEAELANLTENFNEGIDTLVAAYANLTDQSFDFDFSDLDTFPAFENFENFTVTGTGLFNLIGNDVDNVLIGNASNNALEGNAGNDTLRGGLGNDSLKGGEDADIFRFDTALNKTTNVDTVKDFVHLEDVLQLENSIFTKLTVVGELSANNFRQGDSSVAAIKAADANDYILYDSYTGNLYYDADGSGATNAAVQFATLVGQPSISNTDFWVT